MSITALFRRPAYRRYFFARLVSVLGTFVAPIGLAFGVLDSGGDAASLGFVLMAGPIVSMVLMPFAGVAGDRLPRKAIITLCQCLSGLVQAITAYLLLTQSATVPMLAALSLVAGAAGAFLKPAMQGLVPLLVDGDELVQANGLLQIASSGVMILGPVLAGLAVAKVGAGWVLAWDAASYFLSAGLFVTLRLPGRVPAAATRFSDDLRAGLVAFAERRWLVWASMMSAVSFGIGSVGIYVLGPVHAEARMGGPADWGVVIGAMGGGLAVGSITSLMVRPQRVGLILCAGILPLALLLATMAADLPVTVVATAAFLNGILATLQVITFTSFLQKSIPSGQFGRISSTYTLIGTLFVPLAYGFAGPLTAWWGMSAVLWGCAALGLATALAAFSTADVRTLTL